MVLQQIGGRLARQDKRLSLSGLSNLQTLRAGATAKIALNTFADMDDALEQAEDDIIERMSKEAGSGSDIVLEISDFGLTMESEYLAVLVSCMQSLHEDGPVVERPGVLVAGLEVVQENLDVHARTSSTGIFQ